jgi:hypothetical protein
VLALVDLPRLDTADPAARRVDGQAGLEDHPLVGPVQHLGAEHRGRGRLGGAAEQFGQGVRGRRAVVVQQPDPLGGEPRRPGYRRDRGGVPQRAGDRRGVTGVPVHPEHGVRAEQVGQHGAAAVPAASVHRHDAVHRVGLLV